MSVYEWRQCQFSLSNEKQKKEEKNAAEEGGDGEMWKVNNWWAQSKCLELCMTFCTDDVDEPNVANTTFCVLSVNHINL